MHRTHLTHLAPKRSIVFGIALLFVLVTACGQNEKGAKWQRAEVNKPAPEFSLTDNNGTVWNLADLRGKVVFVNFWATWCPPCREEMPSMVLLDRSMREQNKDFVMLTILSNDDPEKGDAFVRSLGATFPVLADPDGKVATAYGLTGVPETYIIDKKGILREKYIGAWPWASKGALDVLAKYL